MSTDPKRRNLIIAAILIAVATVIVYAQVAGFGFTNYDDQGFITENAMVQGGLTAPGIYWAFTTTYFDYWHPLAWLSHMLDCDLFGLNAGWHHLMSALIHLLNSLLLLLFLKSVTGSVWRSALVAGLFALHPLHVESAAWLAERKDLLCGLFWVLAMWAYARYGRTGKSGDYYLTALCFVLALMSKPMAVTLPFVFLLMDYWPLGRWNPPGFAPNPATAAQSLGALVREKAPFFLAVAVATAGNYWAVKSAGNLIAEDRFPLSLKLANVPVSYARYVLKLFWPTDLTPFYPMPERWGAGPLLLSIAVVAAITVFVIYVGRTRRYLVFGWLFFLGTLIPTIGLVAGGMQSIADRYTYLPFIGLFVMVAWGVAGMISSAAGRRVAGAVAVAVLLACAVVSHRQAAHWRNSQTLWSHVVGHSPRNPVAQYNLGHELNMQGNLTDALPHYRAAVESDPRHLDANNNLGLALLRKGNVIEATNYFAKALALKPGYPKALLNMAMARYLLGDYAAVTNCAAPILDAIPGNPRALHGLALARMGGRGEAALASYSFAIQASADEPTYYAFAGQTLFELGRTNEAAEIFAESLRHSWRPVSQRTDLGTVLSRLGDPYYAECLATAVLFFPDRLDARALHAEILGIAGRLDQARASHEETLRLNPDNPGVLNNYAWMLATHPKPAGRDGAEAVRLASRACELTGWQQPRLIGTLAAAQAEAGQFDEAVETARKAAALAESQGQADVAEANRKLLEEYRQHRPFRELQPE